MSQIIDPATGYLVECDKCAPVYVDRGGRTLVLIGYVLRTLDYVWYFESYPDRKLTLLSTY